MKRRRRRRKIKVDLRRRPRSEELLAKTAMVDVRVKRPVLEGTADVAGAE